MDYSGQQFEHYQLIAKLGQGGMATVYKAYDTRLERDVAIKVVRKESIPPEHLERILKRFEREAKALAKFIHPNIVPVHDYGEYQGAPFLVMAYLPGGTLKERIGKPVPVQTALRYVIPIASALSYAHQRGVIHRDVKPSNILITDDGTVMLSDFGIAQVLEEATTQLTATGMGVGTPEYMAPEQWQGQATAASDQYALGVVLYELLTGQKPYSAETPLAVALKVMSEPLPRPSELVPEIQETVEKVLYKALARDPQDRYESMEAFKSALEDVIPKPGGVPAEEKTETINSATGETLGESSATPSLSASEIEQTDIQSDQLMEPHYELELEGETFDALDSTPNSETEIPDEILDDNLEVVEKYSVDTTSQQLSEPNSSKSTKKIIPVVLVISLVVTAIAVGIYLARGRTMQYTYYYDQAVTHSNFGLTAEDPIDSRSEWAQTLAFLDQAESYRITDETIALREQVQNALDLLDGAVRLAYHPAIIGSFTSEINITQIVSLGTDLYLFDEAGGRVIHAERTNQGYEVDPEFVCAAGNFSGGSVGALVDMTSLPVTNTYNAHILASDGNGNIVYCAPGEDPVVQTLPTSASTIPVVKRIVYESGYLYVLDTAANTIRVYQATNYQFLDAPTDFFEGITAGGKPDISQIIDLTVNGQELYLLREDGMLVDCVSSGLSSEPVICENPVAYVDGRVGKEDQGVTMPESNYISVLYTEPPDPAINILDAVNADIYQFSLRFKLYRRFRPDLGDYEVESTTATAFTIGIDRIAFLAFGHQVFYAYVE